MRHLSCILLLPVVSVLADAPGWTANEAMLLYFDAATAIRQQGLASNELHTIVTDSLAGYVASLDPHSRFFHAEAYDQFQKSQSSDYGGVGMELASDRNGDLRCLPYPGSPAAQAGIRDRDRLLAVGSVPTRDMDLVSVGLAIRGEPGSVADLRIQTGEASPREIRIERRQIRAPSVVLASDSLPRIRIYRFTSSTPGELAAVMGKISSSRRVVIDVRGNPGGSLFDAIDSAALFLADGTRIAGVRSRDGTREQVADRRPRFTEHRILLLQDDRTASSAEVFIAALTGAGRATSMGTRTAGKGTTQSMIGLVGGSALLLTTGELLGPDGASFDEVGLPPSVQMEFTADPVDDQLRRVLESER